MRRWFDKLTGAKNDETASERHLLQDPRWRRLHDRNWTCPCCGDAHGGIFDIAFARPDPYSGDESQEHNSAVPDALATGRDILAEDFCVMGPHRFIRCVLPIPIIGSNEQFAFGVWGSTKPENFEHYLENFDAGDFEGTSPFFSWLMNRLPGASNDPVKASQYPQSDRQRPKLVIQDESHPYYLAQRDGVSFDALLDIYAQCGHDMRPYLSDA